VADKVVQAATHKNQNEPKQRSNCVNMGLVQQDGFEVNGDTRARTENGNALKEDLLIFVTAREFSSQKSTEFPNFSCLSEVK
jgi:hypothetical protein